MAVFPTRRIFSRTSLVPYAWLEVLKFDYAIKAIISKVSQPTIKVLLNDTELFLMHSVSFSGSTSIPSVSISLFLVSCDSKSPSPQPSQENWLR